MNDMLNLLVVIILFGIALWIVNILIPMPAAIKSLLNIVVLIILIIYVLEFFGILHGILPPIHVLK